MLFCLSSDWLSVYLSVFLSVHLFYTLFWDQTVHEIWLCPGRFFPIFPISLSPAANYLLQMLISSVTFDRCEQKQPTHQSEGTVQLLRKVGNRRQNTQLQIKSFSAWPGLLLICSLKSRSVLRTRTLRDANSNSHENYVAESVTLKEITWLTSVDKASQTGRWKVGVGL